MTLSTHCSGPGYRIDWSVDKVLIQEKSWYQSISLVRSRTWGRMLFLDGQLIITERDAQSFHELMTHIPLSIHPNPADVVICGAAWGGFAQEAAKHTMVKRILQIEPDDALIDAAVQFWPRSAIASAVRNSKLAIEDLADTTQARQNCADVLLIDIPSVTSRLPAPKLLASALPLLKPQGLLMLSLGSPYENTEQMDEIQHVLRQRFPRMFPVAIPTPSRAGGITVGLLCSDWCTPALNERQQRYLQVFKDQVTHYDAATHSAAFILPKLINLK